MGEYTTESPYNDNFREIFEQVIEEDSIYEFKKDGEIKAVLITYDHWMEIINLLQKTKDVLSHYWFTSEDGDEYNNDDVIDASKEIEDLLERDTGTDSEEQGTIKISLPETERERWLKEEPAWHW